MSLFLPINVHFDSNRVVSTGNKFLAEQFPYHTKHEEAKGVVNGEVARTNGSITGGNQGGCKRGTSCLLEDHFLSRRSNKLFR